MNGLSRRALARLALKLAAVWATGKQVRGAAAGDRGVGGTGAAPNDPKETLGQDRGIGGTGVVGTIRRFGSVVVNDLRVAYPRDVRVTIDGAAATPSELRIGQVVHVLARLRGGAQDTQAIAVSHEVVGPIGTLDRRDLTVLGQRIEADAPLLVGLRRGQTVAVSGLRRPDGTIVASLVARRAAGTPSRLAGPVTAGPNGTAMIGDMVVVGLRRSLVGRRVALTGGGIGGAFHASAVTVEPRVPFAGADRLSIEGYVARFGDELRFGSGVALRAGRAGSRLDDGDVVRAVITATTDGRGRFTATEIHAEAGRHDGVRGEQSQPNRTPGDVSRPGAPDHPSGPGTTPDAGGQPRGGAQPGGPAGGGPGGGGRGGPSR